MALRNYAKSKKNRHREKNDVLGEMDRKLASGAGSFSSRRKKEQVYARSRAVGYATAGVSFVVTVVLVVLQVMPRDIPERIDGIHYESPVELLRAAYDREEIDVNTYAFMLRNLLLNYSQVLDRYKPEYPWFAAEDVLGELRRVWIEVDYDAKVLIAKDFPSLARTRPRL